MRAASERLLLLPGLDGTGALFRRFTAHVSGFLAEVVAYPPDRVLSVPQLVELVEARLPDDGRVFLLGESFSGRVALELAARRRDRVAGVILAASFARCPVALPAWTGWLLPSALFVAPPPRWFVRRALAGVDADEELVDEVAAAVARVEPAVLAARVREVLAHVVVGSLDGLEVLYLRATHDALVGPDAVAGVRATGAHVVVAEIGSAHLLLQRAPAEAWAHVESFVEARSRGQAAR